MELKYLPKTHAAQRIGKSVKSLLAKAQSEALATEFENAYVFTQRICCDLRLDLAVPETLKSQEAESVADQPISWLLNFWTEQLSNANFPKSSVAALALNLAHRTQLVRAFAEPDDVVAWASGKISEVASTFPRAASDIECGRNPGDVIDPYILASTQFLLCKGVFEEAIAATVSHKALMILEGLMGHMHEEALGRMRGNVKNPEPRGENQELFDAEFNPFPGADIIQPPLRSDEPLKLHQVKS